MDRYAFLIVLSTLWITNVEGVYHEMSMVEFKPVRTPGDISFGYSLAFLKKTKELIVGAPQSRGIGKVFKCQVENKRCDEMIHNIKNASTSNDLWLGANVATGDEFSVACAPRFTENKTKFGTFGRCYVKGVSDLEETEMKTIRFSDMEQSLGPFEKYMDSFGWSMNVDNKNSIIVGGPAMYTGRALLYTNSKAQPKLIRGDNSKWKRQIDYTFGYAVTSGFFVSVNELSYAISAPYGWKGHGKVILTDLKMVGAVLDDPNPKEYPPPVGSLFGASMCSVNLRGAKQREALFIGAPTYAAKGQLNLGIVYIYLYSLEEKKVVHVRTLLGTVPGGQFGSAIISLGDLNGDKRDEVAISAPYEDDGRGAVYVYSGFEILNEKAPSEKKWLQRIKPEGYFMVGHSLAALKDNMNTACNELAIGAPGSNKVLFLRCIPQIKVTVLSLEDDITKDSPRARRNETFFVFKSCVEVEYPERPVDIKADITVKVSLTHQTARIIGSNFDDALEYNISTLLLKQQKYCKSIPIIVPLESGYEPVIQYQVTATQVNGPLTANYFDSKHATLSDLSVLSLTDTRWIADCAGDHECIPELGFQLISSIKSEEYRIGSSDNETVGVTVQNTGDVAYGSCVVFKVTGVLLRSLPAACSRPDVMHPLQCKPPQPIQTNKSWFTGNIELDTKSLRSETKEISIEATIYSNCESKRDGRIRSKYIKLTTDTRGLIVKSSTSFGDDVSLTSNELEETGKQLSHTYTVYNRGPIFWTNVICNITLDKKPYFKDFKPTIVSEGPYNCDVVNLNDKGQYTTQCIITGFRSNGKFEIILPINLEPRTLDPDELEKKETTMSSSLKLTFGIHVIEQKLNSKLKMKEAIVPLWVIIAAALVGLLIMIVIAIALYECGFLRRKNKKKLKDLKKNVHRQSMRRSAMRDSLRAEVAANKPDDREKLLEEVPLGNLPAKSCSEEKLPEIRPLPSDVSVAALPPPVGANPERKKKELMILGLQKNIGAKQRPTPPPKPKHPHNHSDF